MDNSTDSSTGEVSGSTANDLGIYGGAEYWISDPSYYSSSWEGDGTESSPFLISSAKDLALLSYNVFMYGNTEEGQYSGVYFKQTSDIDLSGHYWMPIGGRCSTEYTLDYYYFSGNYDGGGYTISNLTTYYSGDDVDSSGSTIYAYCGLFGVVCGNEEEFAQIHDINIEDLSMQGGIMGMVCGAVIGCLYDYAKIYNCNNSSYVAGAFGAAGIVGAAADDAIGQIYNCYNTGAVYGALGTGGVVGIAGNNVIIYDCGNSGDITDELIYCGGVTGSLASYCEIYNCYNLGNVSGVTCVGGIVGNDSSYNGVHDCYNEGSVTGSGHYIGGIVGESECGVYNCYNTAAVTGSSSSDAYSVGGICGFLYGTTSSSSYTSIINNCYNLGYIQGAYYVGGIVGRQGYNNTYVSNVYNCFNTGSVYAKNSSSSYYVYVGGIIGYCYNTAFHVISYCYYGEGTIKGYSTTYKRGIGNTTDSSTKTINDTTIASDALDVGWYGVDGGSVTAVTWDEDYPWDFENTWKVSPLVNDGYPVFQWVNTSFWIGDSSTYSTSWLTANDGTESDPYIIDSAEDLAGLSYLVYTGEYTFLDCYFKQTCDIDLSGTEYNEAGLLWMPIGTDENYFMGNYSGGGYTISGISSLGDMNCVGLFGVVAAMVSGGTQLGTASVHDIGVVDSTIEIDDEYYYVGAVVGMAGYAEIYNCYSSCTVIGEYYVGGIIGMAGYSDVYNCYNTGKVIHTGSEGGVVGGICGAAMYSDVYNCYNSGIVTGSSYTYYSGGIVGMTDAANIYNCYNTVSVTGGEGVAGIVGFLYDASTLYNCFNVGDVTSISTEAEGIGGVVGGVNDGTIAYCYYGNCKVVDGNGTSYQGIGYDATAGAEGVDASGVVECLSNLSTLAKTESWYADLSNWNPLYYWDFDFVWAFADGENDGYPVFDIREVEYWIDYYSTSWLDDSAGTESDPYIIDSAEDLAGVAYLVNSGAYTFLNCHFKQTCDIDLSGKYWTPIGYVDEDSGDFAYFMGNYDGGGHIISGLLIRGESYVGLFGAVAAVDDEGEQLGTASVHDLGIVDSTIVGTVGVGAFVGIIGYTEIYNCYNTGSVTAEFYIGGIVGMSAIGSNIYNCYNSGSVASVGSETGAVGGIVGYVYDGGNISNCYNTGSISGYYYVGGIVGLYEEGSSFISNCYNIGMISGYAGVGGLFGILDGSASVYNCFNVGNVTASLDSDALAGGVAGYVGSSVTISNCYYGDCTIVDGSGTTYPGIGYDESTDAVGADASGVVECLSGISTYAKTLSWFTDSDNWDSTYAWDFSDIWRINKALNDGYPVFSWQSAYIYDEDGGYWYFEDGYMPQSVVSDSDLIANLEASAELTGGSYVIGSEVFSVWAYDGEEYIKVTASGANGTADDSDCTWFVVEPIRWIVAYGSADEAPTEVSTAVSALVVTLGAYTTTSTTNWTFRSLYTTVSENSSAAVASGELSWSEVDTVIYDYLVSSVSQVKVKSVNLGNADSSNTTVTRAGYRVASAYEIDGLGGTYSAKCSDLVAFLLSGGTSTDGDSYSAAYWTRDLAVEMDENSTYYNAVGSEFTFSGALNNGVYVTANGTLSNAKLSNSFGARLSMSI